MYFSHATCDSKKLFGCDIDDVTTWKDPAMLNCHTGNYIKPGIKKENMRGSKDRRGRGKAKDKDNDGKSPPDDTMFVAIQRTFAGNENILCIYCILLHYPTSVHVSRLWLFHGLDAIGGAMGE
jgi:hypothetical protein